MTTITPATLEDKAALYHVCLKTGAAGDDGERSLFPTVLPHCFFLRPPNSLYIHLHTHPRPPTHPPTH